MDETITIRYTVGGDEVTAYVNTQPRGPAGPAGLSSVTSATTSDGTGDLSLSNVTTATATVSSLLTAPHIHGNIAGSVYAHVRAGEDLAKGDPVYVSGSHGSGSTLIAIVSKADAADPAKMPAVGIMDAAIAANDSGHMVITGNITEIDTDDFAVNATLYVAEGGGWTDTRPTLAQPVARVERSNANNGAVIVKVNGILGVEGDGLGVTDPEAFREAVRADYAFDPRDYGAAFDWNGTTGTDDTAAIQAAINAAEASGIRRVRIAGRARITAALVLENGNGFEFYGDSYRTSEIYQATASEHGIVVKGDTSDGDSELRVQVTISNIRLTGRGTGTATGNGIHAAETAGGSYEGGKLYLDRVRIIGFANGFYLRRWDNWAIDKSVIQFCQTAVNVGTFTNTVSIANTNLGSNTVRSVYINGGAMEMRQVDCGNEPQAVYLEAGAKLAISDSNFESFTGTAPTYNGVFEVANGTALYLDNVQINSPASALPGVYVGGVGTVFVGKGGFQHIGNGTGPTIYRENVSTSVGWFGTPGYGSDRTTSAARMDTATLGSSGFSMLPSMFDSVVFPNRFTAGPRNRTHIQWELAPDNTGLTDRLWAGVKYTDGTYGEEPILNRAYRVQTPVTGTSATLAPNTNVVTTNAALATLTLPARASATVTITIATPGVVSWTSHGRRVGDKVSFTTTGALPTGITSGTIYYVSAVINANSFRISATSGGADIATSGSQSGTHTGTNYPRIQVGDQIRVAGNGAGGWKIQPQGATTITYGDQTTAVSTGFIQSSQGTDCIIIECTSITADGYWKVIETLGRPVTESGSCDRIIAKATTGDPASGTEGKMAINSFDNTVKIYADGGWRTIASGW